ncbi:hypothetical protein SAMN04487917_10299 [Arthrobacter sp. yr096]|uniref:FHA domain-containing protein n=1 Tax=Arthrobacter sp. yr096 TaxID=1761750 RepID=UPI0008AB82A7|nr:FHA domain-containing protein [Arthrobacter sp. yr096]SEI69359.1 hypothetical protein SAMN04487917_10299 [Arthrobacter sp. yr096]
MASSNPLWRTRYQQGEWFAVIRNGTVVLLGPDTPHALIDAVWELLASSPEAHEVLHEVTDAFGVSLSRIPPFGIIDSKDGLRVFLRGDLDLAVQSETGEEKLTGRDVTTWTERRLAGAASFSLRIGGTTASGTPVKTLPLNSLPLVEGVVLLASLDAAARGHDHHDATPAIQSAGVSTVEPEPAVPGPVSGRVSDETMIGYAEADLGLTIAPGHLGYAADESAAPEEPASDEPSPEEPASGEYSPQAPASDEHSPGERAAVKAPVESAAGERAAEDLAALEPPALEVPVVENTSETPEVSVHTSTTDPLVPSLENTTNYDHLWDKTVMRTIEDAAVRLQDESEDHEGPAPKEPDAPPSKEPDAPVSAPAYAVPESGPAPSPATPPAPAPASAPADGLIDSLPWLRSTQAAPEAGNSTAGSPLKPAADPAPQLPSAWLPSLSQAPSPVHAVDEDSDHDGQTIMKSVLPLDDHGADTPAPPSAAVNGPSVLARVCSQGHANPPTYPQCSVCGTALSGDAEQVPRPRLGRMRLSTGELIDLDQSLIIGRQPSVSRVQGGTMPRLVQVESPGGDISRSHVEVRLEGWHVMLCDLKATNGTVLIREGQAPRRLAQNEMAILLDGDIAELGDDISLRFEEIL